MSVFVCRIFGCFGFFATAHTRACYMMLISIREFGSKFYLHSIFTEIHFIFCFRVLSAARSGMREGGRMAIATYLIEYRKIKRAIDARTHLLGLRKMVFWHFQSHIAIARDAWVLYFYDVVDVEKPYFIIL